MSNVALFSFTEGRNALAGSYVFGFVNLVEIEFFLGGHEGFLREGQIVKSVRSVASGGDRGKSQDKS